MGDESAPAADHIDFGKKHPLEHTWTLWFDNPNGRQKLATFGKTLRPVYTFNTVEDFWWCVQSTQGAPAGLRDCDMLQTTLLQTPGCFTSAHGLRAAPAGRTEPTLGGAGVLIAPPPRSWRPAPFL
jgi:hypothetical protein